MNHVCQVHFCGCLFLYKILFYLFYREIYGKKTIKHEYTKKNQKEVQVHVHERTVLKQMYVMWFHFIVGMWLLCNGINLIYILCFYNKYFRWVKKNINENNKHCKVCRHLYWTLAFYFTQTVKNGNFVYTYTVWSQVKVRTTLSK